MIESLDRVGGADAWRVGVLQDGLGQGGIAFDLRGDAAQGNVRTPQELLDLLPM
jgi:hypothetical protein